MLKFLKRSAQGASVPHEKATSEMATVQMPVPKNVVIPMSMHIGAPAQPVVKKGDQVYVGTLIGQAGGFVSANIHSSVSGTVVGVAPMRMVNGVVCQAVAIESDGQQTVDPACQPPVVNDKDSLLQAIQACGLVGVGGAGFPTHVKLAAEVDTLLINAAECEPYLTTDAREMLECSDTILGGIRAVMQYCDIPRCIIGIERNKPACIDLMCSLTRDVKGVSVKPLPMRYPQGAEKTLVETCTGREVPQVGPSGKPGLPADVGCIVMNVTSVSTLGKYLKTGIPLVSKRITVDGDAIARPQNIEAPIGALYRDVIEACGGIKPDDGRRCAQRRFPGAQAEQRPAFVQPQNRCSAGPAALHPLRALHRGLPHGARTGRDRRMFQPERRRSPAQAQRRSVCVLRQLHLCLPGQAPGLADRHAGQGLVSQRTA